MSKDEAQFKKLQELIKKGDYFEFRVAIEGIKNVNYQNKEGITLLRFACRHSNFPAVVALLAKGAQPDISDSKGLTPLTISIWKGFLHVAAALLQAGADPNMPDKIGRVPLFFAVRRCDIRAVRLLLDFKADPNKLCPIKKADGTIVKDAKTSLLAVAAKSCFYEGIKLLRDAGAKLDNGTENPLMITIERGNRETLAALLDGQEEAILGKYEGHSLIWHAIEQKTTLLAVIVATAKAASNRMKKPAFPPSDVRAPALSAADAQNDSYLPRDVVAEDAGEAVSVWKPLNDETRPCRGSKVSVQGIQRAITEATMVRRNLEPIPASEEEARLSSDSEDIPSPPSTTPPPPPDSMEETDSLDDGTRPQVHVKPPRETTTEEGESLERTVGLSFESEELKQRGAKRAK